MINKKEDTVNYLGTILFIVLVIFFVSAFANTSTNQTFGSVQYKTQIEIHANPAKAVMANAIQLPAVQKICLSLFSNANFNLVGETHTISYNNKITQRIILFQKTRLLIKPLLLQRFCFHLTQPDTKDLPGLS